VRFERIDLFHGQRTERSEFANQKFTEHSPDFTAGG
jgi:hypothetical protein